MLLWKAIKWAWNLVWRPIDRFLVRFASLFVGGDKWKQYQRYALFLFAYCVIYGGIYASHRYDVLYVPLFLLAIGYLGVLAVGRAWSANESERTRIIKKLEDPKDLPELRRIALLSALQLIILFPLIFYEAQRHFTLYAVAPGAGWLEWVYLSIDSYNKAFLSAFDEYVFHLNHIEPSSAAGRYLSLACRVTVDLLLIQGIVKLWSIHETVRDAVDAVKTTPEFAILAGRRAIDFLLTKLKEATPTEQKHIAEALGVIESRHKSRDRRVEAALVELLRSDPDGLVKRNTIEALGAIRSKRAKSDLQKLLNDGNESLTMRMHAANALSNIENDPRLLFTLVFNGESAEIQTAAAQALKKSKGGLKYFVGFLSHPSVGVRRRAPRLFALAHTGRDKHKAVTTLRTALRKEKDPDVRTEIRQSMESLGYKFRGRRPKPR